MDMDVRAYADTAPGRNLSFGKRLSAYISNALTRTFHAAVNDNGKSSFDHAYDRLVRTIELAVQNRGSLDAAEPDLRVAVKRFLTSQKCPLALKNFDALLEEKSGDKARRDDGTTGWYHEFIPILRILSLVREDKLSLKALEPYGGLETVIAGHWRHDSVEDIAKYRQDKTAFRKSQRAMIEAIAERDPTYDKKKGFLQAKYILINNKLMTKKRAADKGVLEKVDNLDYIHRMLSDPRANPVVILKKLGDGDHNMATLFGASKFTPQKKLERCNNHEDMYGPRYGFMDQAMERWPEFKEAFKALDDTMGFMVYIHFRYLESVDLHYKKPRDLPVGVNRYIKGAMTYVVPEEANMVHIFMKNLMASVDPGQDPEKHARLQNFIEKSIKPSLQKHASFFPYLFKKDGPSLENTPAPVAR